MTQGATGMSDPVDSNPLPEASPGAAGIPVQTLLAHQGAFSEAQLWHLLQDVLPLLYQLHQQQRVHGHLSPETIQQTPNGRYSLLEPDQAAGPRANLSPEYAAPEQLRGEATAASDLYSLGVTCLHLLTALPPFDWMDGLEGHWSWSVYLPNPISDRLAAVLTQMTAVAVADRSVSVEAVLQRLGLPLPQLRGAVPSAWHCTQILQGHQRGVTAIVLHPDRQTVISSSQDKTIRLWHLGSSQTLAIMPTPTAGVTCLALSGDGRVLASADRGKSIQLWDVATRTPLQTLAGHEHAVTAIAFVPQTPWLASGSWDKTIKLWDWRSGEVVQTLQGHTLPIHALAVSPEGRWLASASSDRTVRLWSLSGGETVAVLGQHTWAVTAVAFDSQGQCLATGSDDRTIQLWDVATGTLRQTLPGHGWSILALAFSPDGQTLASGSWNPPLQLWDLATGQSQTLAGHTDFVSAIGYEIDPPGLISASQDGTIRCWSRQVGAGRTASQGELR
jgi:WD40 repeat protein